MTKGDFLDENGAPLTRPAESGSLKEAMRRARIVEAERMDVSADRRDSEIARLELLRAELESIFAEIPFGDDRFALTLSPSRPARLWIDIFAYVAMTDDCHVYELIRNSENGRRVLFSTPEIPEMRARVTSYVARQIVMRERQEAGFAAFVRGNDDLESTPVQPAKRGNAGMLLLGFLAGALSTLAGLFTYVWFTAP